MENEPKPDGESSSRSSLLGSLDTWQKYLVAIVAFLTVVAQLWSILEDRWLLVIVTLAIVLIVAALYVGSQRYLKDHPVSARAFRIAIVGAAVAMQIGALTLLFFYSYFPRLEERGQTRIAVALFDGPVLPDPYKECRPSDMLVRALSRVGDRFGGLTAFELPYSVNPDNRLAANWAQFHGWFDAADVIVYGGYTLYASGRAGTAGKPDEVIINPVVITVPLIPIGYKSAPLHSWTFATICAAVICARPARRHSFSTMPVAVRQRSSGCRHSAKAICRKRSTRRPKRNARKSHSRKPAKAIRIPAQVKTRTVPAISHFIWRRWTRG
jgi:hypothetical protein